MNRRISAQVIVIAVGLAFTIAGLVLGIVLPLQYLPPSLMLELLGCFTMGAGTKL